MHIGTSLLHVVVFYIFIWHKDAAMIAGDIFPLKEAADDEQKDLLLNLSNTEMKKAVWPGCFGGIAVFGGKSGTPCQQNEKPPKIRLSG